MKCRPETPHPAAQHGSDCPEDDDKKPAAPPPGPLLHLRLGHATSEEVTGPETGSPNDADKTRRCAVAHAFEPDLDRLNGTSLPARAGRRRTWCCFHYAFEDGTAAEVRMAGQHQRGARQRAFANHGETQAPEALAPCT